MSCTPPGAICPGSYTANVNPITLTLQRVSNGFEGVLSGSNNISLGSVSEVPVFGQVRPSGELSLWGGVSYKTRCGSVSASFPPGGLSILSWTTVLDATGSRMAGEFRRSATNNFSSCYTTTVLVDARIIVLTRMPASVPAAPVP